MATTPRFDYRAGVEDELRVDLKVRGALEQSAQRIADNARSLAPTRTGAYVRSIAAEVERGPDGNVARAKATVPYAVFVEYGTDDTPMFAPLRRGFQRIGGRL